MTEMNGSSVVESGWNRPRAPKIGLLKRHAAVDEDDSDQRLEFRVGSSGHLGENNAATSTNNGSMGDSGGGGGGGGGGGTLLQNTKNAVLSSFVSVIEGTKDLTISDERQRSPKHNAAKVKSSASSSGSSSASGSLDVPSLVTVDPRTNIPLPTKCSSQMRRLIHSQSTASAGSGSGSSKTACPAAKANDPKRPIYPNLPYSPYGSPNSSPRVKRKPLRETKRVSSISEQNGDYIQLNQYKLEGAIGQGSYGIVKLAYNKEDDHSYAMKILSKKKLKRKAGIFGRGLPNRKAPGGGTRKVREDPLQKVYTEIAIMKKVDHPNVVKLVEVLDDPEDDNLYMVFELLEHGEVLVVPTESPMTEEQAWQAFRDVVLGLEYLHYQKIIHRDIKPSNLLRAESGEVKIADLGVSNEFHGHDAFLTNTAGTPAFTPPESLAHKPGDEPFSGKLADIWSLGVTLFSLLYGQVPFHDQNILALYNKIRTQPLVFPEDTEERTMSAEAKDLISRMLVKDPNKRITLAEVKTHDWVTGYGLYPLPSEEDNCHDMIEVTEKDVQNSVHTVPKLDTLILVKQMIKNHSFSNPFLSIKDKFQSNGRSNSAPGAYDMYLDGYVTD